MRIFWVLLLAAGQLLGAYSDDELEQLWSSIENIHAPTRQDYLLIEQYLSSAKRPYLQALRASSFYSKEEVRMQRILNFKLLGPNQEMPIQEIYHFNPTEETQKRCIVVYGTYNGIYPQKARKIVSEIKESGYSGDVLLRIGGFPNTQFGGLNICHVPYAWKVAFLQEAKLLGYKEVLWIDSAIHPLKNFDHIFSIIQMQGHFLIDIDYLTGNFHTHLPEAAAALHITTDLYGEIPHISSSMIGLNMEDYSAQMLLEYWYAETENVYPNVTWWPEELSLSVVAWRMGCRPFLRFGDFVCLEHERNQLKQRPTVEFYLDSRR